MAGNPDHERMRGNVIGQAERVVRAAADVDADALVDHDGDLAPDEYPRGVRPGDGLAGPLFRKLTGLRYDTGIHVPLGGGDPHAIGEEALVASPGVDGVLADIMRGVASLPHDQRRARSAEPVHKLAAEHRLFGQPAGACEQFAGDVAQAIHDAVETRLKIIGRHRPD